MATNKTINLGAACKSGNVSYQAVADALNSVKVADILGANATLGDIRTFQRQHIYRWITGDRNPDRLAALALRHVFDNVDEYFED